VRSLPRTKTITNDPVVDQRILQTGARASRGLDQPYWSAYLELDYASGDSDPQARTPLTQFVWAPDMNVGSCCSSTSSGSSLHALQQLRPRH